MRNEIRSLVFLIGLLTFIFITPYIPSQWELIILSLGIITFSALFDLYSKKIWRMKLLIVALLIFLNFFNQPHSYVWSTITLYTFSLLFIAINVYQMIKQLLMVHKPNVGFILNGVSGFLLIGYFYAVLCSMAYYLNPGCFKAAYSFTFDELFVFVYYSFVTLATLGYGDVLPTAPFSK